MDKGMSIKKLFIAGFVAVLLVGIPVTVYFIQQQQEIRSKAAPETSVSFLPTSSQNSPINATVGTELPLQVAIDPGTNVIVAVELYITYDSTKFELTDKQFIPSKEVLPNLSNEGVVYTPGQVVVKLNAAAASSQQVQAASTLGTLYLKPIAATGATPTQVTYGSQTVAKVGGATVNGVEGYNAEGGTGDVLKPTGGRVPAFILIASAAGTSGTPAVTGTITPSPTTGATNASPICTNLALDRAATGAAPYSITFTANGTDDTSVNKVTFNYGDGPVEDITTGGGLGTKSVSVQKAHTYNNPGTYTASVILTDDKGAVSSSVVACTQTITVTSGTTGGTTTGGTTSNPTPTFFAQGPILSPGPEFQSIAGIGAIGIILTIIGAAAFFAF